MIQQERLIKTVEYLKANQTATLAELARLTEVSIDTARRDLGQLEAQGMLKRVRGGAVYHQRELDVQVPFEVRQDGTPEAKREIVPAGSLYCGRTERPAEQRDHKHGNRFLLGKKLYALNRSDQ